MRDESRNPANFTGYSQPSEPSGVLQRALYLWERQPPSTSRISGDDISHRGSTRPEDDLAATETGPGDQWRDRDLQQPDFAIEERLRHHAGRLIALERVIPGDRRLDSPRFSLMMLNAFLGRAVTDGVVAARLRGLLSICERIDNDLADLEIEYPNALDQSEADADKTPIQIREEMRSLFADLKSLQKAQQRQLTSSLSALHTAISELRSQLPDRCEAPEQESVIQDTPSMPNIVNDLAQPLIDPERLVDPRPVLAAARAAAARVTNDQPDSDSNETSLQKSTAPVERPYRSVLLGTALLGLLMIIFGREAAQFLTSAPITTGALARP